MRDEFSRIITLISFLILLSTTNVSATPMPIMEGSTFKFERIRTMSCEVYPYRYYDDTEMGEKEKYESEYLITDIDNENEKIIYNNTRGYNPISRRDSFSIDQVSELIHPSFETFWRGLGMQDSNRIGEVYFHNALIPKFIKPDFQELNNMIKESLYREDDNHLEEAIELEFMGKDSIVEGAEKLNGLNRKWSIYLYFINDVKSRDIDDQTWEFKVWREWEYSIGGLLKYSKIRKEAKLVKEDDWCTFEAIYKNIDSIFSPLYGTEVYNPLYILIIPIIFTYLWIKRKKNATIIE